MLINFFLIDLKFYKSFISNQFFIQEAFKLFNTFSNFSYP
jgi:hypothetical protein